jgi:hypothetical protein
MCHNFDISFPLPSFFFRPSSSPSLLIYSALPLHCKTDTLHYSREGLMKNRGFAYFHLRRDITSVQWIRKPMSNVAK